MNFALKVILLCLLVNFSNCPQQLCLHSSFGKSSQSSLSRGQHGSVDWVQLIPRVSVHFWFTLVKWDGFSKVVLTPTRLGLDPKIQTTLLIKASGWKPKALIKTFNNCYCLRIIFILFSLDVPAEEPTLTYN